MKIWRLGILFYSILLMVSCQSESTTSKKADALLGKWELVEGYRGGKKTESLTGTYFQFGEKTMSTNLPIRGATDSPYVRKENIISQTVINNLTLDYTITELTDDRLILNANLRDLEFVFILEKPKKE